MKKQTFVLVDTILLSSDKIVEFVGKKLAEGHLVKSMCAIGRSLAVVFEKDVPDGISAISIVTPADPTVTTDKKEE